MKPSQRMWQRDTHSRQSTPNLRARCHCNHFQHDASSKSDIFVQRERGLMAGARCRLRQVYAAHVLRLLRHADVKPQEEADTKARQDMR